MPRRNRRDTGRRREFIPADPEPSYEDLARELVAAGKCSARILDTFGRPASRERHRNPTIETTALNGRNPA